MSGYLNTKLHSTEHFSSACPFPFFRTLASPTFGIIHSSDILYRPHLQQYLKHYISRTALLRSRLQPSQWTPTVRWRFRLTLPSDLSDSWYLTESFTRAMENVQTVNDTKYDTPSQESHRMAAQGCFTNKSILWQQKKQCNYAFQMRRILYMVYCLQVLRTPALRAFLP